MRENFVQPLGMSFQANQEMQGRGSEKEIHHEAILHGEAKSSHAMRNSKGQQLQEKFKALSGVHCIYTIYRFEAQEVRSPTLQTVCKSELKWRSYIYLKATAQSWGGISHWHFLMQKFSHWHSLMRKFSHWLFPMWIFSQHTFPMRKYNS